jgi:hypothetical protein
MKNIHIIPTDKPSRLYKHNELGFKLLAPVEHEIGAYNGSNQNIYITSDEEIRRGDYFISLNGDESYLDIILNNEVDDFNEYADVDWIENCKKIIITDNKDLINDGVQAIDDEFLEWFVKNPSCESVEVGYGWIRLTETDNEGYWVSIPDKRFEMQQEEPKQEIVGYRLKPSIDRMMVDDILKNAMPIWNDEDKSVYFIRGHVAGSLVAKMKELQVLDLWFIPIYEDEEIKSDWVKENHLEYYYKEGIMSNKSKQQNNE